MSETIDAYQVPAEEREVPITLVFVRHGQADTSLGDSPLGPPLTRLGTHQAARVADRLEKEHFDHAYTSDLVRAYDTAMAILKHHKDTPYTVTKDAREVTHYHFLKNARPPDSGVRAMVKREQEVVEKFAAFLRSVHRSGARILVVCHGNFIRTILPLLGGRNPAESVLIDINNTAVSIIELWASGEAVVKLANCTKHLLVRQVT